MKFTVALLMLVLVAGASAVSWNAINRDLSIGDVIFVKNGTNYVGINTPDPQYPIDINGDAYFGNVLFDINGTSKDFGSDCTESETDGSIAIGCGYTYFESGLQPGRLVSSELLPYANVYSYFYPWVSSTLVSDDTYFLLGTIGTTHEAALYNVRTNTTTNMSAHIRNITTSTPQPYVSTKVITNQRGKVYISVSECFGFFDCYQRFGSVDIYTNESINISRDPKTTYTYDIVYGTKTDKIFFANVLNLSIYDTATASFSTINLPTLSIAYSITEAHDGTIWYLGANATHVKLSQYNVTNNVTIDRTTCLNNPPGNTTDFTYYDRYAIEEVSPETFFVSHGGTSNFSIIANCRTNTSTNITAISGWSENNLVDPIWLVSKTENGLLINAGNTSEGVRLAEYSTATNEISVLPYYQPNATAFVGYIRAANDNVGPVIPLLLLAADNSSGSYTYDGAIQHYASRNTRLGSALTAVFAQGVGIGTDDPQAPLHVQGTFRVDRTNGTPSFIVDSAGRVGINTSTPHEALSVRGRINASGTITSGAGLDLAEAFGAASAIEPGLIVSAIDADTVQIATNAFDAIGVVSTQPGMTLSNTNLPNPTYVALAGRVPVQVEGPVLPGDFITVGTTPGTGKAAREAGPVLGRALSQATNGVVLMLVQPMYFRPSVTSAGTLAGAESYSGFSVATQSAAVLLTPSDFTTAALTTSGADSTLVLSSTIDASITMGAAAKPTTVENTDDGVAVTLLPSADTVITLG